jgi:transcriptional regulator with XRE-family HTH domain
MAADTFEAEEFLANLGALIRSCREARGVTQAELGARIGVARCSVANIEAGRQDTTVCRLAAIASVLGIDMGDLR